MRQKLLACFQICPLSQLEILLYTLNSSASTDVNPPPKYQPVEAPESLVYYSKLTI